MGSDRCDPLASSKAPLSKGNVDKPKHEPASPCYSWKVESIVCKALPGSTAIGSRRYAVFIRVCESVYAVGGPDLSDPCDCLVYAVDLGELVLIDCGCGPGWAKIGDNMEEAGFDRGVVNTLVLTHSHVDHIGAAARVESDTGCQVVAHALDQEAIETGDPVRTAAGGYGIDLVPMIVSRPMTSARETLSFAGGELHLLHTPGHTPGSLVAYVDTAEGRALFGQDIHGPFRAAFGSDIQAWRESMAHLLALEADILCEGHYGIYRTKEAVRNFIEGQLELNS